MSTTETTVAPEELLTMPDGDSDELIDGQLVEKEMAARAAWVVGEIWAILRSFVRQNSLGCVYTDGVQLRCPAENPDRIRKPDACFVRRGRFVPDEPPEGFITIAPDLVVEAVSPTDFYYDVECKVEEYLDAGVLAVWVINPDTRTVKVYEKVKGVVPLHDKQELAGGDVLPGFRCAVSDFLPPFGKRQLMPC